MTWAQVRTSSWPSFPDEGRADRDVVPRRSADPAGREAAPLGGNDVAAFAVPNFRLYCAGQAVSLVGTWMQGVAQSWLVLELT